MNLLQETRRFFTPKRGIWEGALLGLFLASMHSWWVPGPGFRFFTSQWSHGLSNLFQVIYIFVFGVMGRLGHWPGDPKTAWEIELLTVVFFGAAYAGVWALLKGRFFWLGFSLLLLTLFSLVVPVRFPFI